MRIVRAVKKIGSGINGHRRGLIGQVSDRKVDAILVESATG
ncbi:hypothetical protein MPNT_220012 [Candidatus Methylacidithermus pantelleriae]|uniref:Uncharacterized protein n=1 Tax=Candidatus Methylacidithermus pantelleriae TaxID=2744239 RepID=A0A8J2BPU3_9BACT|nr:hypothetical protein MPNT_220012 [Candidatus Methylacidithermus pantelleriae]